MPANLTQQYLKAEEEYRRATTREEELACLQVMLQEIPKHKGTDHLQADLKAKIAQLKKDLAAEKSGKKSGRALAFRGKGPGRQFFGGPNAGKSQLIAPHPGHARGGPVSVHHADAHPGHDALEDVTVQLIDTPPITTRFHDSHLQGLIRAADLALLMVDLGSDDGIEQCQEVLDRLAAPKPGWLRLRSWMKTTSAFPSPGPSWCPTNRSARGRRSAGAAARALPAGFH